MPPPPRQPLLLIGLLCALALGASLHNSLVWSSRRLVQANPAAASLRAAVASFAPARWRASSAGLKEAYRPVANLSFALDNALWRGRPAGYHLANLCWHVLAVAALFLLAYWVLVDFRVARPVAGAWFAAAAFALHPALVEAAVWVENRGVLICALLCFAAYAQLLAVWRGRVGRLGYVGAGVAYAAALVTHEAAVALPITLALHAALRPDASGRNKRLAQTAPFFVAAAAFTVLRLSWLKTGAVLVGDTPDIPWAHRALAVVRTVGGYMQTLLLPVGLCADRYFVIPRGLRYPGMWGASATLVAWAACLAWASRRRRLVTLGLLALAAALLPVSNLVLIPGRPMADQRLYLPALGLCLVGGAAFARARRHTAALLVALLCTLAALATTRCFDFADDYAFWREAMREAPRKSRVMMNLAIHCRDRLWVDRAEKLFGRVVRLYPTRAEARHQLGKIMLYRKLPEQALDYFASAHRLSPAPSAELCVDTAVALVGLERYPDALAYAQQAKALPNAPSVVWRLASDIHRKLGQSAQADADARQAQRRAQAEAAAGAAP